MRLGWRQVGALVGRRRPAVGLPVWFTGRHRSIEVVASEVERDAGVSAKLGALPDRAVRGVVHRPVQCRELGQIVVAAHVESSLSRSE